jgi:hypothetical protein
MQLLKDKREAFWIPYDWKVTRQIKRIAGKAYGFVEFIGTKEEQATAKRLGRPVPRHQAWVNMANLEGHGGI